MVSFYFVNVTIHVLAAFVWLGGLLFLGVVGAPALRRIEPASVRAEVFQRLGKQFRPVSWIALAVLLVTGVVNLYHRGLLNRETLGDGAFWLSPYGLALAWKLTCVAAIIAGSAVHDFVWGPAASQAEPGSPEALKFRQRAARVGRVNAVIGVLLIIAAVRLTRGF
jgi:putative copper resistance protein D